MKHKKIVFLALLLVAFTAMLTQTCLAQDGQETPPIATATQVVWFIGCFFGSLARLVLPVPRKSTEIKSEGWNHRYTGMWLLTIAIALLVTGLAFPAMTIPEDVTNFFTLFWLAFGAGYGGNAALIELSEYIAKS